MKIYQVKWSWPKDIESWISKQVKGFTLNVCCGKSRVGNVRIDLDERCEPNIIADVNYLPFIKNSFDTVICDPPFKLYNKFKWIYSLSDVCRERFILSHPLLNIHLKAKVWVKRMYGLDCGGTFLRLVSIWDKTTLLEIMK